MAALSPGSAEGRRTLGARATTSALWASAETWGQQFVQLVVFITLARLLGPEAYGLVGIALIVTTIGILVINRGGWAEAVIQEQDLDAAYLDTVFWWVTALSVALFAAVWAAAGSIAGWFETPEVEPILPWLALILPLKALGVVQAALLRREMSYRALALRSTVAVVLGGAAGITAALLGAGAWSLVINHVGQLLVETLVLWLASAWRPGWRLSVRRLAQVVTYASGVLGARALEVSEELIARSLVARAIGVVAVGHYTVARRLLMLSEQLLVAPPSNVAMPVFSQIGRHGGSLQEPLRLGIQITALVAFPGYIGLALVVPDLLPLVFGSQWTPAAAAIQLAVLIGPALAITRLCTALLLALGRTTALAGLNASATAVLLVGLFIPAEPTVETVMMAFLAQAYLTLPLLIVVVQRITPVDVVDCLRGLVPLVLATLVMATAVAAVQGSLTDAGVGWRLPLSIAAGIGTYGLGIVLGARPLIARAWRLIRTKTRDPAPPAPTVAT